MTYRCIKGLVSLGAAVLVGCAAPLPTPTPPAAALVAPPPLTHTPPPESPAPVQPTPEPTASDTSALPGDQAQTPPMAAEPWKERGLASWYGKRFNGRRTASGERFSAGGFTAAHRTLPMPSYVRVRRVGSGEEVIVRINDRGPFHAGRVLDLSYAAAKKIGILGLGSAEVEIELLTEEESRLLANSTPPNTLGK